jgi:hypothetical protein
MLTDVPRSFGLTAVVNSPVVERHVDAPKVSVSRRDMAHHPAVRELLTNDLHSGSAIVTAHPALPPRLIVANVEGIAALFEADSV